MSGTSLPTNANVQIGEDGPYYQVQLEWLPRIGDSIELYSALDAHNGDPATHSLRVTNVSHQLTDVTEKPARSSKGSHFVTVFTERVA